MALMAHPTRLNDVGMCTDSLLVLLGVSRCALIEGNEPVPAKESKCFSPFLLCLFWCFKKVGFLTGLPLVCFLIFSGAGLFELFEARGNAQVPWVPVAEGCTSVVEEHKRNFLLVQLEGAPNHYIA